MLVLSDAAAEPTTASQPASKNFLFAVASIVVALIVLRVVLFWVKPFWLDETYSGASVYFESLGSLFKNWIVPDVHPPLYPVFLFVWCKLFGAWDLALRLPSLIFGVGAICVLFFGLRRIIGASSAAIAALVLAAAPNANIYSAEARPYGLVLLLSVLATVFAIRYALTRRKSAAVSFTLAAIALSLTHYFGLLLCCGLFLWLILRDWRNAGALILPCLCFAVAVTPWLVYHFPTLLSKSGGHFWIRRHSIAGDIYVALTGAWGEDRIPNALIFELFVPFIAVLAMRRRAPALCRIAVALFALTAVELAIVVGVARSSPVIVSRYFLVFTPIAAVIAGIMVGPLGRPFCWVYALALPFAVTLPWAASYFRFIPSNTIAWEVPEQRLLKAHAATVIFFLDDPLNIQCSDYQLRRLGEFFFRRGGSNIAVVPISLKSPTLRADIAEEIVGGAKPVAILKPTTPIFGYENHDALLASLAKSYDGDCFTMENSKACIFH
ncbi:MAG: glycosyltransferase family 39 protein [Methylovirgula sp.]